MINPRPGQKRLVVSFQPAGAVVIESDVCGVPPLQILHGFRRQFGYPGIVGDFSTVGICTSVRRPIESQPSSEILEVVLKVLLPENPYRWSRGEEVTVGMKPGEVSLPDMLDRVH